MFVRTVQYLQWNSFVKLLYFVCVCVAQETGRERLALTMIDVRRQFVHGGRGKGLGSGASLIGRLSAAFWRHCSYIETARNWSWITELVYYDNHTANINCQLLGQALGRASDRRGGAQTNHRKFSTSLLDRCRGIFQAPVSVAVDRHNRIHRYASRNL